MTSRDSAATRQRILDQARRQFARHGYATVTVKGVADAAEVSPNLITRYFGGKEGLFLAATRVELPVENSFDGDLRSLGSRLAARIVERWFGAPGEDPLLVLQRAAGERPEAAEALAAFLDTNSLEPLHRYLRAAGLPDARCSTSSGSSPGSPDQRRTMLAASRAPSSERSPPKESSTGISTRVAARNNPSLPPK